MSGLLRRHPNALSKVGSQILLFAVPVLAATVLDASTRQVALLGTSAGLPYLLFGLLIGAWSDRLRHRPVLIAADVTRLVVLAWIPVSAMLDMLHSPALRTRDLAVPERSAEG